MAGNPNSRKASKYNDKIINDIKFHYRVFQKNDANAKSKILLVHGMGGSTYCWRNNSEFLNKNEYQVVAEDLPGFGYTERKEDLRVLFILGELYIILLLK